VRWLLAEWPEQDAEPVKYWLATLPAEVGLERLVGLAKLRWRSHRRDLESAHRRRAARGCRSVRHWRHLLMTTRKLVVVGALVLAVTACGT
jgi:SRSO17 transposase